MKTQSAPQGLQLSAKHIIRDGTLLSVVMSGFIMGVVYYNPQILHDDYPPDMQEKAKPMSEKDKKQRLILFGPSLGILFGVPFISTLRLRRENKGLLSFPSAFLNTYLVFLIANAVDLVIIDYLIAVRLQPRFMRLPGTEDMVSSKDNTFAFHFKGFLKGMGIGLLPSLVIGLTLSRKK